MAATPSKDYKRREREQKKLEKRMAREAAKAEKVAAERVAEQTAIGEAVQGLDDLVPLALMTESRLLELRRLTVQALTVPQEACALLRAVAASYGIVFSSPEYLLLAQTTIHAALVSLQRAGEAEIIITDNRMLWRRSVKTQPGD